MPTGSRVSGELEVVRTRRDKEYEMRCCLGRARAAPLSRATAAAGTRSRRRMDALG